MPKVSADQNALYNSVVKVPSDLSILERLLIPEKGQLPSEVARYILSLEFDSRDHQRVAALSAKARRGALETDESAELDAYIRAADVLAMLKSKARRSLRKAGFAA